MTRIQVFDPTWEVELFKAVLEFPDDQPTQEALQLVRPEWFLVGMHRALWSVILKVQADMGGIDEVSVWTEVKKDRRFSEADRLQIQSTFLEAASRNSGTASTPMEALREAFVRRTMSKLSARIGAASADFQMPIADLEALALQMGDIAISQADREDLAEKPIGLSVSRYLEGVPLQDPDRAHNLVVFGIPKLDDALVAGPGSFGLVAARPSAGKTSLAVQAAVMSQHAGIPTAIFSFEMDFEEVSSRVLACASGHESNLILRHGLRHPSESELMRSARGILAVTKIPGRTFSGVTAKIRQLVRNRGIRLVIVDYFTLINPAETGRHKGRNDAAILGEMSKGFKALASDLGIHILLVSQLNRTVVDGERPTLECLRETGQLEQDASFVLMGWSEKAVYEPDENRVIFWELQKNRGGRRWVKAKTDNDPGRCSFTQEREQETGAVPPPSHQAPLDDGWGGVQ